MSGKRNFSQGENAMIPPKKRKVQPPPPLQPPPPSQPPSVQSISGQNLNLTENSDGIISEMRKIKEKLNLLHMNFELVSSISYNMVNGNDGGEVPVSFNRLESTLIKLINELNVSSGMGEHYRQKIHTILRKITRYDKAGMFVVYKAIESAILNIEKEQSTSSQSKVNMPPDFNWG
tara:strand:- start:851 stop:1378 length:528 start_codon:yes stop_codon:yes gene_type:complete